MAIDFDKLVNGPIFATLAVPAVLTLEDARTFALSVVDKTAGVQTGVNVEVPTVEPSASIRYSDLTALGLNADDIIRATLSFNGFTWTIRNHKFDPNPSGERAGIIYALLTEQVAELASSES